MPEQAPTPTRPAATRSRLLALGALSIVLASAVHAYLPLLRLGILGWDSYPMILTSRAGSVSALVASLGQELMGGLYPHARYYRPIANLTLAGDHALWGLDPFGYHLTDLLLLIFTLLCVWRVGRRLLGDPWSPLLAVAFVAHHPMQIEALPVIARRPDSLALLFTLLAVLAAPEPGSRAARWRGVVAAIAPALAVSSKEAGAVALPVVVLYHWFASAGLGATAARVDHVLRASAAPALLFAAAIAVRFAVLGGAGGPQDAPLAEATLAGWLGTLGVLPRVLLVPRPVLSTPLGNQLLALVGWGLLIAGAVWASRQAATRSPDRSPGRPAGIGFLTCWLLLILALPAVSGGFQWWYGIPALPPLGLLLASIAARAGEALRRSWRPEALAAAIGAGALAVLPLRFAPLVHDPPEWRALDAWQAEFLAQLDAAVRAAEPGASLRVNGLPLRQEPLSRRGVQSAWGLSDYSVQAYLALTHPERPVRVALGSGFLPSDPAEIRVVVSPPAARARGQRPQAGARGPAPR